MSAVCWNCVEDTHLKKLIKEEGEVQECSECGETDKEAFSAYDLAESLAPIIQEHYAHGEQVPTWGEGDDDSVWYEQEGESLFDIVQEVLGQYFDFSDEIVDELIENDGARPQDGEEPFFSNEINYVETRLTSDSL